MADSLDPSPRRTRSRSRIASGSSRRTRSRTFSKHAPPDPQPVSTIHSIKPAPEEHTPPSVEKRPRHKMTDYQLQRLEELYQADTHPSRRAKETLAAEVGMSVKSVLIWFQNRRQDRSKKMKAVSTPALTTKAPHGPVHTKLSSDKPPTQARRRPLTRNAAARAKMEDAKGKPSPSPRPLTPLPVSLSGDTTLATPPTDHSAYSAYLQSSLSPSADAYGLHRFLCHPPPQSPNAVASHHLLSPRAEKRSPDLWKHLPPTPPSRNGRRSARPEPACGSPLRPLANVSNFDFDFDVDAIPLPTEADRPEKPTLEWACANSAARRKHGLAIYRDEDDSSGESSDFDEADLGAERWVAASSRSRSKYRPVLREVTIPSDFQGRYSPDVVMGASLLLTLKHSADDTVFEA